MEGLKRRILSEIMTYKGFRKQSQLAQFLEISPQLLNKWFNRDTFDVEILLKKLPEVSLDFLLYGRQPMLKKYIKVDDMNLHGENEQQLKLEIPGVPENEEPIPVDTNGFSLSKELENKERTISALIEQHGILINEISNIIKEISESGKRTDKLIEKIIDNGK